VNQLKMAGFEYGFVVSTKRPFD